MRNRKPIPGLYDDVQLRTMEAALDRVIKVMSEMGAVGGNNLQAYRRYVAGVIVTVARQQAFEEDELTQHVLEALIRPPANNDPVIPAPSIRKLRPRRPDRSGPGTFGA